MSAQNDLLEKHQEEIERLTAEFEDQIKQLKEHNEIEAHAAVQRYEHLYLESETVRSKNAELEDDIQQVNQKLQQLEMENQGGQEWEQQMEESRHEVSELLEKLSKANEALNEKDDRMKQMQKECEGLKTELAAARDVLSLHEDLQKELEETRRQRDAIELRVNELANETKLAEERLKRERDEFLEEKRRVEESGLLKSSTSEERTNTDNSQSEEQLIHLSGVEASGWGEFNDQPELQQTPPTIHQLSAEITRLSEELDQERTMTGELRAKLTESEENMESARRSSEEAEKKRLDLVERLTALQTETRTIIENLEGENEKIRKENDGFEKEIAHLRESLSGRDADENSRAEAERQREAESAQTQAEFEAQKQRLKEELDVVRQQRLLLEKQIDELKEEKKLLEELNEVLTIDKSALEEKLTKQEDVRSDKEELVSSLRNELKALRDATDKKIAELNEREDQTKLKLRESAEELEKSTKTIESLQAEIDKLHTQIGKIEEQRNKEKEEENIVRNQYVKALETVKEELLVANGKEKEMKKAEEMRKELEVKVSKLEEELKQKEEQVETVRASASQSTEAAVLDIKQKAEKKLAKLKQTMDGKIEEAQTAKQGAEAEVEKLRASLAEVEKKFDAIVVDKAKLEQQLILRESIEKELQEAKYREEKTSSKVNELEKKIWSLEEEVARIEEEKAESEEERSKLQEALEKNKEEIEQLQEKIKSLSESNEESFRKAAAKQDSESKKVVRELQREVKQLYVELNEKSEALDAARKALEEGGLSAKIIQTTTAAAPRKPADSLEDAGRGTVDHSEELESMRNKLAACHKDLDELRDEKARLERALEAAQKGKSQPATVSVNGGRLDEHPGFADPAEAEYLKNVLYQYMLNRENLGHEALTLARVIGTVAKFDKKELDAIIHKEESRLAGWVGSLNNTVSHLASNAYPSNTGR
ncbi:hypothetical protein WR25_19595 [Diploscapter pachys]|uniref:GRIP domain-containing protein n=1 Tax=Diploscapter pachys TaxID=2018661 RepID=A0A2A2LCP5_9BILA|nr:hypothetical protein WR25_19595 [Diploscapter pachys]